MMMRKKIEELEKRIERLEALLNEDKAMYFQNNKRIHQVYKALVEMVKSIEEAALKKIMPWQRNVISDVQLITLNGILTCRGIDYEDIKAEFGVGEKEDLTYKEAMHIIETLNERYRYVLRRYQ